MDPITRFLLENATVDGHLYHYALDKNPILYTIRKQIEMGDVSDRAKKTQGKDDPLGRGLSYQDQISFFLEPVPVQLMREKMPENQIYNSKSLYEHKVSIDDLEEDITFQVVIAPMELMIIRIFSNISRSNLKLFIRLMKIYAKLTKILYVKTGINTLKQVQKDYGGETLKQFEKWINNTDKRKAEYRKRNYQAGITHVKVYPKSGEITPVDVRKI